METHDVCSLSLVEYSMKGFFDEPLRINLAIEMEYQSVTSSR